MATRPSENRRALGDMGRRRERVELPSTATRPSENRRALGDMGRRRERVELPSTATRPSENRRALREIGNTVGSHSTTCIVAKAQRQRKPLQTTQVKNREEFNGPIASLDCNDQSRSGAELAARSRVSGKLVAGDKENVKEGGTASSKKKRSRFHEFHEPKDEFLTENGHFQVAGDKKNVIESGTASSKKKRSRFHEFHEPKDEFLTENGHFQVAGDKENVKESETASSKKKRSRFRELHEPRANAPTEKGGGEEEKGSLKQLKTTYSRENLYETCEVEMEDVESTLHCIDISDSQNPSTVVVVDDSYNFYRKTELSSCVPLDYMSNQTDINPQMRAALIDWLIGVHFHFDLMHETLFIAINLIDRYLSRQSVLSKYLGLLGITGMLLACKYEVGVRGPLLESFFISDGPYSREDVFEMGKSILNTLQFNLIVPTPFVFMRMFLKAAEFDTELEKESFYLIELCMVEYQMLKFPPSLLSAAAVYTGRWILRRPWDRTLAHHSTYSEDQLQECGRLMLELRQNASQGSFTAVYRKYLASKYSYIALLMKAMGFSSPESVTSGVIFTHESHGVLISRTHDKWSEDFYS